MGPLARSNHALVILTVLFLTASSFVTLLVVPSPPQTASAATSTSSSTLQPQQVLLSDNFTHDTSLSVSKWAINGPVGSVLGQDDVGSSCSLVPLEPTFSSAGMEVAEVAGNCESSHDSERPVVRAAVQLDSLRGGNRIERTHIRLRHSLGGRDLRA